jgi:8-oxo-dGTP diphosphatase
MTVLQFGQKQPGKRYLDRPGVYAVIMNEAGLVAGIESGGELFLPGGGIEPGETESDALHREIMEEAGWRVDIGRYIGRADQYVYSKKKGFYINQRGRFYTAVIISLENIATEDSSNVLWTTSDTFAARAAHQSHIWAIRTSKL